MNTGIAPEHLAKLRALFAKHPQIADMILYGSRAKGTYREGSDIDIALKGTAIDTRLLAQIASTDLKAHIDRVGISLMA